MTQCASPAVVLVRPQEEGNVGAAARAMANMGLEELILVEPAPSFGRTAYAFAVGAREILDQARRTASLAEALAPFQRVVGTTSARHRQLGQRIVEPRQLPGLLAGDAGGARTAIVFGPEPSGLSTEELTHCDPLVTVPCSTAQPTLNLAQAVLIVAYELAIAEPHPAVGESPLAASIGEVERLLTHLETLFQRVGFARDDTYPAVVRDLRRFAARAQPTAREVQILHGICRRTLHALGAAEGASDDAPGPRSE
jgi:TrmH family RNA methyltransferase